MGSGSGSASGLCHRTTITARHKFGNHAPMVVVAVVVVVDIVVLGVVLVVVVVVAVFVGVVVVSVTVGRQKNK